MRSITACLLIACSLLCFVNPNGFAADEIPASGDTTVVDFVYPGNFKDALEKAKKTGHCVLIKGVAFGVDKLGAKCATKGHW